MIVKNQGQYVESLPSGDDCMRQEYHSLNHRSMLV